MCKKRWSTGPSRLAWALERIVGKPVQTVCKALAVVPFGREPGRAAGEAGNSFREAGAETPAFRWGWLHRDKDEQSVVHRKHQPKAAPALAFITVPVSMRARSEAIDTAAFAVSWTVAESLRKLDRAMCAIAWSFVIFSWPVRKSIVS
jgi:hypothetical protein